jgi:hypothetical protein
MSNNTSSVSGSYFIVPNVSPAAIDGVFRKTPLLNAFAAKGRVLPSGGSSPVKWNWIYSDQVAASAWTENQAITSFGGTLSTQASKDMSYGKVGFGVSDFQMVNQANGGLSQDVLALEAEKALGSLGKYFEDLFCGSSAGVGISSLIDSTGNVEGIDQSTYTGWASIENTCSGSSFVTVLDDTYSDLMGTNASLQDLVLFMSPAVFTIYQSAVASNMRGMYGQPLDLGKAPVGASATFNGIPIVVIPGASATELYFVDMSKAAIVVHEEPSVHEIAATNMGENLCARAAMSLVIYDRPSCAKVTQIDLRT